MLNKICKYVILFIDLFLFLFFIYILLKTWQLLTMILKKKISFPIIFFINMDYIKTFAIAFQIERTRHNNCIFKTFILIHKFKILRDHNIFNEDQ